MYRKDKEPKRHVHTTISEDLYKLAQKRGLKWQDVVKKGIEQMMDLQSEKEYLQKQFDYHYHEMEKIKQRIDDIDKSLAKSEALTLERILNIAYREYLFDRPLERQQIEHWATILNMNTHELVLKINEYIEGDNKNLKEIEI